RNAGGMSEADGVIGQLQIGIEVILATAPNSAVAVLVAGEIVEDRQHQPALGIGRIYVAGEVGAGDAEFAVRPGAAIQHHAVEIGLGDIAAELPQPRPPGPRLLADLGALELARRVLRYGEPEADLVGAQMGSG